VLPDEPDATSTLTAGADLVTASGDKLLGGPQAGLLFGDAGLIEQLRRHPAARALRVDKLTLAALEATLVGPPPPVAQALTADVTQLRDRADRLAGQFPEATAVDCVAAVGGGGAPGVQLPSAGVSLPESYAVALRTGDPPVVGRLERGRCLLDLRTVPPENDELLAAAVRACSS
jgi:L-seryl-tRNA(Ser) seleniumtransferase